MNRRIIWGFVVAAGSVAFGCSKGNAKKETPTPARPNDTGGDTGPLEADTGTGDPEETDQDTGPGDTGTGSDNPASCINVVCRESPDNVCADDLALTLYNAYGWCAQGECSYAERVEECLTGPCASGICTAGPCQGVRCDTPPPPQCADGDTVRRYNNIGFCLVDDDGDPACQYASEAVACETGCDDGKCAEEDPCAHVVCDTPPARYCNATGDLMVWDALSRCENGECIYEMQSVPCANGCSDGRCEGDLTCGNTRCDTPPAAFCLDDTTLKAFESTGTCEDGACIHPDRLISCANGCADGQCIDEPCAGVSCEFKPVSHCANDAELTYWDGVQGACAEGVCHFGVVTEECPEGCAEGRCTGDPCLGVHCDSPPVAYCDGNTLVSFPLGNCEAGTCDYPRSELLCPDRCEAGRCASAEDTDTATEGDSETGTEPEPLTNTLIIGDAGEGGQVITGDLTLLSVEDDSLPPGSTVTVEDALYDTVEAGGRVFQVITGFALAVEGTAAEPLTVSTPNEDQLPQDSQILMVELVDVAEGIALNMVGTAAVTDDSERIESNLTNDGNRFLGTLGANHAGTYLLIVTEGDQGFTTGQVLDTGGSGAGGLHVHSSSDIFIGVTDGNGYFVLPDSFGSKSVFVTDPVSGEHGSAFTAVGEIDQMVEIRMREPLTVADDSLPNGCLDAAMADAGAEAYLLIGNAGVVTGLSPLAPLQGGGMVLMTTGDGAEDERMSGLEVTFTVPAGVATVNFNYLYLSDEYPDLLTGPHRDLFHVFAYTVDGGLLVYTDQSDDAEMVASETVYGGEKSWKGVSVSVLEYAGLGLPLTLSLVVGDVADTGTESAVLIDNLRFDDEICDNEIN